MLTVIQGRMQELYGNWRNADAAMFVLRMAIGGALMMHGLNKLFDLYPNVAPAGMHAEVAFMHFLGVPGWLGWVSSLTELTGGFFLAIGFISPLACIALGVDMLVAVATYNAPHGFYTETPRDGWEINLIYFTAITTVFIMGPGRWSVDRMLGFAPARIGLHRRGAPGGGSTGAGAKDGAGSTAAGPV